MKQESPKLNVTLTVEPTIKPPQEKPKGLLALIDPIEEPKSV